MPTICGEFISKALDLWGVENKVKLRFIQPGKPTQNAYIESFNGKFRDECLNEYVFVSLEGAGKTIEAWRRDYNANRPHSSLGNMTPEEFSAAFKQAKKPKSLMAEWNNQRGKVKIVGDYMTKLIFRNPDTRFDVAGDRFHFELIVQDMLNSGGDLAPSDHWNWNLGETANNFCGYTNELFDEKYSHLSKMLDPWVGIVGMRFLDEEAVEKYENFLRPIDHMQLLSSDILTQGKLNGWRETDLGSILDLSLITIFLAKASRERLAICEVGGGYGRVAEIFLETHDRRVHYVMIDAVPGSLMYAYYYLKGQFPELNIGSFYAGDDYDSSYDCYILPSWRTSVLPESFFDICLNIESMQEMQQHHVDFYLDLFDRLTVLGGEIYLSNARDYVFKGEWNIFPHWETLYLNNTPRSWSANHPTHILRKNEGDYSLERCAHESAFRQQIVAWNSDQLICEQKLHIADRDRICGELQKTIDDMKMGDVESKIITWLQRWNRRIFHGFFK